MRFVNADGRAGLLVDDEVFDVASVSGGQLPADPMDVLIQHWDALVELSHRGAFKGGTALAGVKLGPPVPRPSMIFAVIANFPPTQRPTFPMVVGKSPSAISGPFDDIVLPDPQRLPLRE